MKRFFRRMAPRMMYGMRGKRVQGRLRLLLIVSIVLFIILVAYNFASKRLTAMADAIAQSTASNALVGIINETVYEAVDSGAFTYDDMYRMLYAADGSVTGVVANTARVNYVTSGINNKILERINALQLSDICIPIGMLLDMDILSGRGFDIPIKVMSTGNLNVELQDSFTSAGINQTKHSTTLLITGSVLILMPTGDVSTEVSHNVPVVDVIILGKVPENYTVVQVDDVFKPDALPITASPPTTP